MTTRGICLIAAAIALAAPGQSSASVITTDPNLPALYPPAAYVYQSNEPDFNTLSGSVRFDGVQDRASGPVTYTPSGSDERETYNGLWVGTVSFNGGPFVAMTASGTELSVAYGKLGLTTGTFNTELLSMDLTGSSSYGSFRLRESPTHASAGQTTIAPLGGGLYQIDSFFDVFTELSLDGGQTWAPSSGTTRVILGPVPEPSGLVWIGAALLLLVRWARRVPAMSATHSGDGNCTAALASADV